MLFEMVLLLISKVICCTYSITPEEFNMIQARESSSAYLREAGYKLSFIGDVYVESSNRTQCSRVMKFTGVGNIFASVETCSSVNSPFSSFMSLSPRRIFPNRCVHHHLIMYYKKMSI